MCTRPAWCSERASPVSGCSRDVAAHARWSRRALGPRSSRPRSTSSCCVRWRSSQRTASGARSTCCTRSRARGRWLTHARSRRYWRPTQAARWPSVASVCARRCASPAPRRPPALRTRGPSRARGLRCARRRRRRRCQRPRGRRRSRLERRRGTCGERLPRSASSPWAAAATSHGGVHHRRSRRHVSHLRLLSSPRRASPRRRGRASHPRRRGRNAKTAASSERRSRRPLW